MPRLSVPAVKPELEADTAEAGWRENQGALEAGYGNCQGWSQILCALKVWLEHGINLRDGMYV